MAAIMDHMRAQKARGQKSLALLVDPDKLSLDGIEALAAQVRASAVAYVLVGGSLVMNDNIRHLVPALKQAVQVPVILFPGNALQVTPDADGILFLSLISGRNPDLLIGNHVIAAPLLKQSGIEVLPTGYLLIDSGRPTAAHYMSNTQPIPHHKPEIAACTALAGTLLGLQLIYLDGGSGAEHTVSTEMVAAVAATVDVPLIVGGGIRTAAQAQALLDAGADIIVVGNALEKNGSATLFHELSALVTGY